LLRRDALDHVGLLDEIFFAHMEEIDLDWRLHLAGYRVMTVPHAVVFHQTGGTLSGERLQKMVLNHRNNLIMLMKNHTIPVLLWLLPLRLFLETLTVLGMLFLGQPKRSLAVLLGIQGVLSHLPHILKCRKMIAPIRVVPESKILKKKYRGSIALEYFIRRRRQVSQFLPMD